MGSLSRDTNTAAEAVVVEIMSRLPAWKKLEMLNAACRTTHALMLAGLRERYPDVSQEGLHRLLMDRLVGEEIAERVWGPRIDSTR